MTEYDDERTHELKELLWEKIHDLIDDELQFESEEVEAAVRERLAESFRFWKRYE